MTKEPILYFDFAPTQYIKNQSIVVSDRCNTVTCINIGTTTVYFNGIPLYPGVPGTRLGESFTLGGNKGEIFTGRVDLGFDTGVGKALIVQKYYVTLNRPDPGL